MWKPSRCPATNEWVNRGDVYIHYSAVQMNEGLLHAMKYMSLKKIMPGERSQS